MSACNNYLLTEKCDFYFICIFFLICNTVLLFKGNIKKRLLHRRVLKVIIFRVKSTALKVDLILRPFYQKVRIVLTFDVIVSIIFVQWYIQGEFFFWKYVNWN